MKKIKSPYHGFRFPGVVICCAVRWYHRFAGHRGAAARAGRMRHVRVDSQLVRPVWDAVRASRKSRAGHTGSSWHLDELMLKLRGESYVLWRAMDEHGTELDVLLQKHRNKAAAKRFFKRVLRSRPVPKKIVTDQLRSYPAAKAEVPELAGVKARLREGARTGQ
jgi:putative transposase